ncbi:hypothetical protein SSZBM1_2 [Synechococcus phage S-SZBM1]|uniref:Uncharacterized protein n=1 Tax=Synechococcus phage S-SZBM1 TaxID=2926475 RepID=A0AC61TSA7_9CAUD|nr:hypothetical protein PP650_gp002 [Synechococcus phage S-SZBM1]UNH61119.1 hypothetical protein SSZBM1_2 [Synechococcus phage S-SZBM1]
MSKTITLETNPPVAVKIWEKNRKHFWRYDYEGCPKYGPFTNYQQALADSLSYSNQ